MQAQTKLDWRIKNMARKNRTAANTLAKRHIRKGRPTLIHNSASRGTFIGSLKETYKFGPAFSNKDRKSSIAESIPAKKAIDKIEAKEGRVQKRRRFWDRVKQWFNNILRRRKNEGN